MSKQTIYLALTDDWELRGDGSGEIERIQFQPMRELLRLYNQYGARSTFNAEMMQQLAFRQHQELHPELKTLADGWDEHVIDAHQQGHDIQLHLHTQWSEAKYENGVWRLSGDWSILNYEPEAARAMLRAGKEYLENLLRKVDAAYRCVAFRAGSLALAPSPHILNLLAGLGIEIDTSIVGGLRIETRNVQLNYETCEESFLPFYPNMDDARRVSNEREKIICVPIFHFYGSRRQVVRQILAHGWRKTKQHLKPACAKKDEGQAIESYAQQEWADAREASGVARLYHKAIKPSLKGKHLTSDFSRLNRHFMREMLQAIRQQAAQAEFENIPVVLTNHSKNIEDYAPIESFLREASAADDIKFITLTELTEKLRAGEFEIKSAVKN